MSTTAKAERDNPAADALDWLWRDIILARNPKYGDWEYPGQAYRHLLAEHNDALTALKAAEQENARLRNALADIERMTSPKQVLPEKPAEYIGAIVAMASMANAVASTALNPEATPCPHS